MRTRPILTAISIIVLLAIGITGLISCLNDFGDVNSSGQRIMNTAQFVYAILSLFLAADLLVRWQYFRPILFVWLVSFTIAAGMSPIVWGNTSLIEGLVAGVSAAAVGAVVAWIALKTFSS